MLHLRITVGMEIIPWGKVWKTLQTCVEYRVICGRKRYCSLDAQCQSQKECVAFKLYSFSFLLLTLKDLATSVGFMTVLQTQISCSHELPVVVLLIGNPKLSKFEESPGSRIHFEVNSPPETRRTWSNFQLLKSVPCRSPLKNRLGLRDSKLICQTHEVYGVWPGKRSTYCNKVAALRSCIPQSILYTKRVKMIKGARSSRFSPFLLASDLHDPHANETKVINMEADFWKLMQTSSSQDSVKEGISTDRQIFAPEKGRRKPIWRRFHQGWSMARCACLETAFSVKQVQSSATIQHLGRNV